MHACQERLCSHTLQTHCDIFVYVRLCACQSCLVLGTGTIEMHCILLLLSLLGEVILYIPLGTDFASRLQAVLFARSSLASSPDLASKCPENKSEKKNH